MARKLLSSDEEVYTLRRLTREDNVVTEEGAVQSLDPAAPIDQSIIKKELEHSLEKKENDHD